MRGIRAGECTRIACAANRARSELGPIRLARRATLRPVHKSSKSLKDFYWFCRARNWLAMRHARRARSRDAPGNAASPARCCTPCIFPPARSASRLLCTFPADLRSIDRSGIRTPVRLAFAGWPRLARGTSGRARGSGEARRRAYRIAAKSGARRASRVRLARSAKVPSTPLAPLE